MPPVPTEPIYFEPPVVQASVDIRGQSCIELDNAIRYLQPYRYSYKPDYYADTGNTIAASTIVLDKVGLLGGGYLIYSRLVEEKEQRRMLGVEQQIAMIQQVKAEKHCFE